MEELNTSTPIQFLDYDGLQTLWAKIKDGFAHSINYDETDGTLKIVDGNGNALETPIDVKKIAATAVSDATTLQKYATTDYVGLVLYVTNEFTDNGTTYSVGPHIIGPGGSIIALTKSDAGGSDTTIGELEGQISGLLEILNGKDGSVGLVTRVTDVETDLEDVKTDLAKKAENIAYDSTEKWIYLTSGGEKLEGTGFDASVFIKDSFLDDVTVEGEGENRGLQFVFNVDSDGSQKETISVKFSDMGIKNYEPGTGISIDNNTISVNESVVYTINNFTRIENDKINSLS